MSTVAKKTIEGSDVVEKTRERLDLLFEEYDHLFVAHSAGKDSTSVWNMTMDAWERHGGHDNRIKIIHHCPEFRYPEEMEYFQRVWERWPEETHTYWTQVPYLKSLLVNEEETWRYPYDERDADRWMHDIPDFSDYDNVELVRPDHPSQEDFKVGMKHHDIAELIVEWFVEEIAEEDDPRVANLTGIRAQESLDRYSTITTLGGFISDNSDNDTPYDGAHPCYDWTARDIWAAHHEHGWDYNEVYDKMHQLGYAPTKARNGPMWGPHPIKSQQAQTIRHYYPELYERAERRFEGAHLSFEFGYDLFDVDKPEEKTWREYCAMLLNSFDEDDQDHYTSTIEGRLERHYERTDIPLKEETPCPICGYSWKEMAKYLHGRLKKHYTEIH